MYKELIPLDKFLKMEKIQTNVSHKICIKMFNITNQQRNEN